MQEKLEKGRTITGLSKSQQGEKEHTTHKKKLGRFLKDIFVATLDLPRQIKHQNDS